MRFIKHLTTWLLLLTVITASGLVSAKVASGVQNLSGNLHQQNIAANALLHLAKIGISYDAASGFPLATKSGQKLLPAPKTRGRPNTAPQNGTIFVDSKGNAIPTPPGGRITGSPDGRFIQARDANGNPTGVRIDGGHSPKTHTDPRALGPHGHVPGVTNADGTPWLPIKQ